MNDPVQDKLNELFEKNFRNVDRFKTLNLEKKEWPIDSTSELDGKLNIAVLRKIIHWEDAKQLANDPEYFKKAMEYFINIMFAAVEENLGSLEDRKVSFKRPFGGYFRDLDHIAAYELRLVIEEKQD